MYNGDQSTHIQSQHPQQCQLAADDFKDRLSFSFFLFWCLSYIISKLALVSFWTHLKLMHLTSYIIPQGILYKFLTYSLLHTTCRCRHVPSYPKWLKWDLPSLLSQHVCAMSVTKGMTERDSTLFCYCDHDRGPIGPLPWTWHEDSEDLPCILKINFLGQCFQERESSIKRQTDTQTDVHHHFALVGGNNSSESIIFKSLFFTQSYSYKKTFTKLHNKQQHNLEPQCNFNHCILHQHFNYPVTIIILSLLITEAINHQCVIL